MTLLVASHNESKLQLQLPSLLALTATPRIHSTNQAAFLKTSKCDDDDEIPLFTLLHSLLGYSDLGAQLVDCRDKAGSGRNEVRSKIVLGPIVAPTVVVSEIITPVTSAPLANSMAFFTKVLFSCGSRGLR